MPKENENGFTPITTQEDFNRALGDRIQRATKQVEEKYADYEEIKAKAAKFDQQESANKSEMDKLTEQIEKLTEKVSKADERANTAEAKSLKARIQATHKISDEDAALFLTATDEAGLTKQAEALAARETTRRKGGNHVSQEGHSSEPKDDDSMREFTRNLFDGAKGD